MTAAGATPRAGGFRGAMRWTLLRLFMLFGLTVTAHVLGSVALSLAAQQAPRAAAVIGLLMGLLLIVAYRSFVRLVEGRPTGDLVFAEAPAPIGIGLIIGSGLFAMVYAILHVTGHLTFLGRGDATGFGGAVASGVMAAVGEEIILRGVVFRVLDDGLGTLVAVTLSAGLFGLLHGANPSATAVSTIAIALEAGVLLALAYAATRNLWLPIGLHFGWNFTEGGVFGAAVSGTESRGLLRFHVSGSDLITGGAFGPEASVVAVVVCLLAAAGFGVVAARRRRWEPMRIRMRLEERVASA